MDRPLQPDLRSATPADADAVAQIWHEGWRDGHLGHVADELVAIRTLESFRERVPGQLAFTTVATVGNEIAGFTMLVDDEVEQVYVSGDHRGSGVAALLLDDAEAKMRAAGYESTWLAVVAGNARARAFYSKRGWDDAGSFDYDAAGPTGPVVIPCRKYTKRL